MRGLVAAAATIALFAAIALIWSGARPAQPRTARPSSRQPALLRTVLGSDLSPPRRSTHRRLLAASLGVGAVIWLVTGWAIALPIAPAVALGVPALLRPASRGSDVELLTALESWTRGLSGVLTVGTGIEHAIITSLSSTPEPLRPAVGALVARLRARWATAPALRAFAEDLDDATGDLVAAALILGTSRRGPGLVAVLDDLAATVAEEVRIRRGIEADRAKPRGNARVVTLITLGVLGSMTVFGADYVAPYGSATGQLVLVLLLAAYVGCLLWMRTMSAGDRTPRFLPAAEEV